MILRISSLTLKHQYQCRNHWSIHRYRLRLFHVLLESVLLNDLRYVQSVFERYL